MRRPGSRGRLAGALFDPATAVVRPGLVATAALLLATCGGPPAPEGSSGQGARTYRVRGTLSSLPDPGSGTGELHIRHEAIPDFLGASGELEPMPAMTMSFPVAEGVELDGLAGGDAVLFELRVDWQAARPVVVTGIERLAAATGPVVD